MPTTEETFIKRFELALIVEMAGNSAQAWMLEMFAVVAIGMPFKSSSAPTPDAVVKMLPSKLINPDTVSDTAVRVDTTRLLGMTEPEE